MVVLPSELTNAEDSPREDTSLDIDDWLLVIRTFSRSWRGRKRLRYLTT